MKEKTKPYRIIGEFNSIDKIQLTPKKVKLFEKKGYLVEDWKL